MAPLTDPVEDAREVAILREEAARVRRLLFLARDLNARLLRELAAQQEAIVVLQLERLGPPDPEPLRRSLYRRVGSRFRRAARVLRQG